jgi:hypothetical protein
VKTIYDVTTLILFAGLVVLFLQRSMEPENPNDKAYYYLPAGIGCALANYLGNNGQDLLSIMIIFAVAMYALIILKPFTKLN